MRLFFVLLFPLLWLTVMSARTNTVAAVRHGCCTAFSKARTVTAMVRKAGAVRCRPQGITEGCSINAIVVQWKGRKVCVDPTPKKMRKLLPKLCKARKPQKGGRKLRRKAKL